MYIPPKPPHNTKIYHFAYYFVIPGLGRQKNIFKVLGLNPEPQAY